MTCLAVYAGRVANTLNPAESREAIDPLGRLEVRSYTADGLQTSVGHHAEAPCRHVSYFEDGDSLCLLAGDVVNHSEIDWPEIRAALAAGDAHPESLRRLRGSFGLVVVDRSMRRLWVVTDPSAWMNVLICPLADGCIVSTSIAAVLQALPGPVNVDVDWIYQSLYFNHGVSETSPIQGASRLPPGSITEVDLDTFEVSQRALHRRPALAGQLRSGDDAVEEAIAVFRQVVPEYFPEQKVSTVGISEGLDCRTLLAALPAHQIRGLHSFTFGMPSSSEISEAADIASRLELKHRSVLLDQSFLDRLPQLAMETVFLSGGQQNINRSHLLYTYDSLRYGDRHYPVIVTGVSGDHIFRDHVRGSGNVPHILSEDAISHHHRGRQPVNRSFFAPMLGEHYEAFEHSVESALDQLQDDFGEFGDPEAYLSYLMFEAGPRYFGGQAAIANSFSTFRTPYWDPAIIELGYRLQNATAGLSAALPQKDLYRETHIQAGVIAAHETVSRLPYKDLPIGVYARGSKLRFQSHRLCRKLRSLVRRSSFVYSEDWRLWYRTAMRGEVKRLLGEESRVRSFVSAAFIDRAIEDANVHWLGKLVTTEHTLRLVETGWKRP